VAEHVERHQLAGVSLLVVELAGVRLEGGEAGVLAHHLVVRGPPAVQIPEGGVGLEMPRGEIDAALRWHRRGGHQGHEAESDGGEPAAFHHLGRRLGDCMWAVDISHGYLSAVYS